MARSSTDLLTGLLRDVSRSFYLTLRVLPRGVRQQIGLAYLLARTSDTLADTPILPASSRLQALTEFGKRVAGERQQPVEFPDFTPHQTNPAEATLLRRSEEAIHVLETLAAPDQILVRRVLKVIISGQILDLQRFDGGHETNIIALKTDSELDDYTYRVAGVVGDFWTRLCRAHLFPLSEIDEEALVRRGINFGKGLQLVNILRDLPRDLRQGRCYIPQDALATRGLIPAKLLEPGMIDAFRPLYLDYLQRADRFLCDAWDYTNALPRGQMRVRLGCAWPVLIGRATVKALRTGNVLDPQTRIKISRKEVRGLMVNSLLAYPRKSAWNRLFERAGQA